MVFFNVYIQSRNNTPQYPTIPIYIYILYYFLQHFPQFVPPNSSLASRAKYSPSTSFFLLRIISIFQNPKRTNSKFRSFENEVKNVYESHREDGENIDITNEIRWKVGLLINRPHNTVCPVVKSAELELR